MGNEDLIWMQQLAELVEQQATAEKTVIEKNYDSIRSRGIDIIMPVYRELVQQNAP